MTETNRRVFVDVKPGFAGCWEIGVGVRQNGHKGIRWGVSLPEKDVEKAILDFHRTMLFLSCLDKDEAISEGDVESAYYLARGTTVPWHVLKGVEELSQRPSIIKNKERILNSSLPDHGVIFDASSSVPSVEGLTEAPILCTYFNNLKIFFRKVMIIGDDTPSESSTVDVSLSSRKA